jgi:hypothetical protein
MLDGLEGNYLPGLEGPRHDRVRARLRQGIATAVARAFRSSPGPGIEDALRCLEGAGRIAPIADEIALFMERSGFPRAAWWLRRG